jgi:AcrR family transcriptional regulator
MDRLRMGVGLKLAAKSIPSLRDSQKANTRRRILEASRKVFCEFGYYSATVDRIVTEIGASRQTFYFHFNDREELLAELVAEFVNCVTLCAERLPGPQPSMDEVRRWVLDVAAIFERDRALYFVISEVSSHGNVSGYGTKIMDAWMSALGRYAPAFAAAAGGRPKCVEARARAEALVVNLIWAATNSWMRPERAFAKSLSVETVNFVAQLWYDFLHDSRFQVRAVSMMSKKRQKRGRTLS